jgi:hypothetical protein
LDDVIARSKLLEHSADRVCHVDLGIQGIPGADASTPLLAGDETVPVLDDSFLGGGGGGGLGSAPGLSTHVDPSFRVNFHLRVCSLFTTLSTLTSLGSLWLEFQSPQSRPDRESLAPICSDSVPPRPHPFSVKGAIEHLESLVAGIDGSSILPACLLQPFPIKSYSDTSKFEFISGAPALKPRKKSVLHFGMAPLAPTSHHIQDV